MPDMKQVLLYPALKTLSVEGFLHVSQLFVDVFISPCPTIAVLVGLRTRGFGGPGSRVNPLYVEIRTPKQKAKAKARAKAKAKADAEAEAEVLLPFLFMWLRLHTLQAAASASESDCSSASSSSSSSSSSTTSRRPSARQGSPPNKGKNVDRR